MEQLVDQVNANGTVLELMEPPITSRFLMKSSSTKYFLLSEIWNLRPLAVTLLWIVIHSQEYVPVWLRSFSSSVAR